MTSKTPVSILQEMCIRRGNPPHYDLIHDGGGTHEAIFKYQVNVEDVRAIGSGRSKKEAKHDAARNMLRKLKDDRTSTPEPMVEEIMEVGDVTSPYEDKITENAIGALQELCMTNEIKLPEYVLIGDEGPPHAKQFTIKCLVSKLEEIAVARTKKQAKQFAANKMLNMLKTSLADVLSTASVKTESVVNGNEELNSEAAVAKYKELGTLNLNRGRTIIGQKISEYHLMLKCLKSDLLDKLKESNCEIEEQLKNDPVNLLMELLTELNIESQIENFETCVEIGFHISSADTYMVLLTMTTIPEAVVFGKGSTETEAYEVAATNAVKYLTLMNI